MFSCSRVVSCALFGAVLAFLALAPGHVLAGGFVNTYTVDTNADDPMILQQGCSAITANDCSLRGAITKANATATADLVNFSADFTIPLAAAGPTLSGNGGDTIDATSRIVIIDAVNVEPAVGNFTCLGVNSNDNTIIGLQVTDCLVGIDILTTRTGNVVGPNNTLYDNTTGIRLAGDSNDVRGNFVGTDTAGTAVNAAGANSGDGINVAGDNNVIGGSTGDRRNVISGNGTGIDVETAAAGTAIRGNHLGTDAAGTADLGNSGDGVEVNGTGTNIGGSGANEGNLISGNNSDGIEFSSGNSNFVRGNRIGTDVTGTLDLGNTARGINLVTSLSNTIGGNTAGSRNLISGNNAEGILVGASSTGNTIQGNYVGTNASGSAALGNTDGLLISASNNAIGGTGAGEGNLISANSSDGIEFSSGNNNFVSGNLIGTDMSGTVDLGNTFHGINLGLSSGNTVGGTVAGSRNVISGNNGEGIRFGGSSQNNTVQGNYIGTTAAGTAALGNALNGINFVGTNANTNSIGGSAAGARNVISGNLGGGITISTGSGQVIQGNYIGTDFTGATDLGNTLAGITVATANNDIGGISAGTGNLISGNTSAGISLNNANATGNEIYGNYIGLQADGTSPLGNSSHGIFITSNASNNTIGLQAANIIAYNTGDGINIVSGTGNNLRGNSIHSNGELAIDLGTNGVTPNDGGAANDADTGPNNLQNFPTMTAALSIAGTSKFFGTFDGALNTDITIDFYNSPTCDSSSNGEGLTHVLTVVRHTDGAGVVDLNAPVNMVLAPFTYMTAIATDPSGNTSEFSPCRQVSPLIVNSAADPGDGICTVDNTTCTLREAITAANTTTEPDIMHFAIASGPQTIPVDDPLLPTIVGPLTIDATTQPGFSGAPIVQLDGALTAAGVDGLTLSGTGNVVKGLVINNFGRHGILLTAGSESAIQGNYIGLDLGGVTDAGNTQDGIRIDNSANNAIGGDSAAERNVISGNNQKGVQFIGAGATNNLIAGNIIGLDATGTVDVGNSLEGLYLGAGPTNNRIGDAVPGGGNVISGNNFEGIELASGSSGTVIANNLIGTDISGTLDRGNTTEGVLVNLSPSNVIGGTGANTRNVISGNNSDGIEISGASSSGTIVRGNFIGTDINGTQDVGNSSAGVNALATAPNTTIGGTATGAGNVISGNNSVGITSFSRRDDCRGAGESHRNGLAGDVRDRERSNWRSTRFRRRWQHNRWQHSGSAQRHLRKRWTGTQHRRRLNLEHRARQLHRYQGQRYDSARQHRHRNLHRRHQQHRRRANTRRAKRRR